MQIAIASHTTHTTVQQRGTLIHIVSANS